MRRISEPVIDIFNACTHARFHRHENAYLAIVLEGSYCEYGPEGRYQVCPGMAILHPTYHAHGNDFAETSGQVLNLPVPAAQADMEGYRVLKGIDVDYVQSHSDIHFQDILLQSQCADPVAPPGWLTPFTALILDDARVSSAAERCAVTTEHAIRVTKRWFGLTPVALKKEYRVQQAIRLLKEGCSPAEAAFEAGFSDQPHLTRVLKSAIGLTPARVFQS